MTGDELRQARRQMTMSQSELARCLQLTGDGKRMIRRMETGEKAISGPIEAAVKLLVKQHASLVKTQAKQK